MGDRESPNGARGSGPRNGWLSSVWASRAGVGAGWYAWDWDWHVARPIWGGSPNPGLVRAKPRLRYRLSPDGSRSSGWASCSSWGASP